MCLNKALNHLLNIPDEGSENSEALNLAVDVVGAASDVKLTTHLTNYLLGDVDGTPKVTYSMNYIIIIIIFVLIICRFMVHLLQLFHRRTRASYVYNECLAWYNVVLTHGSTQA